MTSTAVSFYSYKAAHVRRRRGSPESFNITSHPTATSPLHSNNINCMETGAAEEFHLSLPDGDDRLSTPIAAAPLDDPNVRYLTWGIFSIAYDVASTPLLLFPTPSVIALHREPFKAFLRFLKELWNIDQWHSAQFCLCTIWATIAPAISLFIAYLVIRNIEAIIYAPEVRGDIVKDTQIFCLSWLSCGLLSHQVDNMMIHIRIELGGRLRAYFIPRLAEANLRWDLNDLNESLKYFPFPHDYAEFIPGWGFLEDMSTRLRHISTILLEVAVMAYIISQRDSPDGMVLAILTFAFLTVTFISPTNAMGGAGYTFWTKNPYYNRLMVLFNIIFDQKYHNTLVKDGMAQSILKEYQLTSDALGIVKADTWILGWGLPPSWYWAIAQLWTISFPMALCALTIPWFSPPCIISSMALIQYATFTMYRSIESLRAIYGRESFLNIMTRVEKFYYALDKTWPTRNYLDYPSDKASSNGMKITAKNMSYRYPTQGEFTKAVNGIELTIEPGKVIIVAGANKSGKSTLVKLLCGLMNPTTGEVLVDGNRLMSYDINQLRQGTVFVGQDEVIYPVSLRENIVMGLGHMAQDDRDPIAEAQIEDAARLGGSLDTLRRLGYDAVLDPCSITSYSLFERPGRAAFDALRRHSPDPLRIPISKGEEQRLIASRAIMKAKYGSNVKLIILDEATNALDAIAESEIFTHFKEIARQRGQTMIVVTHRLLRMAEHADLILCMEDGNIKEQGTHNELIHRGGAYAGIVQGRPMKSE